MKLEYIMGCSFNDFSVLLGYSEDGAKVLVCWVRRTPIATAKH